MYAATDIALLLFIFSVHVMKFLLGYYRSRRILEFVVQVHSSSTSIYKYQVSNIQFNVNSQPASQLV